MERYVLQEAVTSQEQRDERPGWLKKTLRLGGFSYLIGDIAMFFAATVRNGFDKGKLMASVSWFVGGAAAAFYGNPDEAKQLEIQAGKLEEFFKRCGISIPDDARNHNVLLKRKNLQGHVEQFLHENPSQVLNAGYAIGAGTIFFRDALPQLRAKTHTILPGKNICSDLWVSILVMAGALGGLFIKEDPEAMEKAKDGNFLDKTIAWIKEKPLRFSASMFALNNIPLGMKVVEDFKNRKTDYATKPVQPHLLSGLQLATYIFSNVMLFLSPRNQISTKGFAPDAVSRLEDAAARVIAVQSAEQQPRLIDQVSEYLAKQKGITAGPVQINERIGKRVVALNAERVETVSKEPKWAAREDVRKAEPVQAIGV